MIVRFKVPGVPIAQPRPRATLAHGGKGARIHEVTHIKNAMTGERRPHPIAKFKAAVAMAAAAAYDGPPLAGPLRVDLTFLLPRPKAITSKKKPNPRCWAPKKPDRDNLEKSFQDALNGQLWVDDSQIVTGQVRKMYAAGDEQPCVEVEVTEL